MAAKSFPFVARRYAPWLLLAGLLVVALGIGGRAMGAGVEHNAGLLALNHALAHDDPASQAVAAWRARGIAYLSRAATRQPDRAATWRALGYFHLSNGDESQAIVAWQRAGEMLPELRVNAEEAERAGRDDKARDWYRRMTAVAPGEATAWRELGLFYERHGDWVAAAEAYENGVANADNISSDLLFNLGWARHNLPAPDWAVILDLTERALAADAFSSDWNRVQTHSLRGQALQATGRLREARDEFAWIVEQQADNFWATVRLAQLVWVVDGDAAKAERLFHNAVAIDGNNKWGYLGLAQLYAGLGRLEEARPLFERVRELDPADATAGEWLARN